LPKKGLRCVFREALGGLIPSELFWHEVFFGMSSQPGVSPIRSIRSFHPMSKLLFLALSLIFVAFVVDLNPGGLDLSRTSKVKLVANSSDRPSIGVRWAEGSSRHQIVFVPATPLLMLVGLSMPMGLIFFVMNRARLA
jgi:hypothetical protein